MKTIGRKAIVFLLVFAMVLSMLPISVFAEETGTQLSDGDIQSEDTFDLNADDGVYAEAIILGSIQMIPNVGMGLGTMVTPFLDDLFGTGGAPEYPDLTPLIDAINALIVEVQVLQRELDASTKEILKQIYTEDTFSNFETYLNQIASLEETAFAWMRDVVKEPKLSEDHKTLKTAELFKSTDMTTASFVNTVDILRKYLTGTYKEINVKGSMLENAFNLYCTESKLGGEAALKCGAYLNQVCNIVNNAYAVEITVLQAKQYIYYNLDTLLAKTDDPNFIDELQRVRHDYEVDFSGQLQDAYDKYDAFFLTEEQRQNRKTDREAVYAKLPEAKRTQMEASRLNNTELPQLPPFSEEDGPYSVENYNNMIKQRWFNYIRSAEVTDGRIAIDFVPLNKTMKRYRPDKTNNDFGMDWTNEYTLIDRSEKLNADLTATISADAIKAIADHIMTTGTVFLPERPEGTTGTVEYSLEDLMKNFGFEFPDAGDKDPYLIRGASAYEEKAILYHGYVNGLTCSEKCKYDAETGAYDESQTQLSFGDIEWYYLNNDQGELRDNETDCFYAFMPGSVEINSEADFKAFMQQIADGHTFYLATVNLNTDLTLTEPYDHYWDSGKFESQYCFRGYFNGNGHKIYGLKDNKESTKVGLFRNLGDNTASTKVGLFRNLGLYAEVKDLTIVEPEISCSDIGYVGALAGRAQGAKISNVTVEGGSITCNTGGYVGGIIGLAEGSTLINCANSAHIEITESCDTCGGIAGYGGNFCNCVNKGTLEIQSANHTGGVAGVVHLDNMENCYNGAQVISNGELGGVLGNCDYGTCTNCYYDCDIGPDSALGWVPYDGADKIKNFTGMTTAQMQAASGASDPTWVEIDGKKDALVDLLNNYITANEKADFVSWKAVSNDYPVLRLPKYEINAKDDFIDFIYWVASGKDYKSQTVNLNADIDLSGIDYNTVWPESANENVFSGYFNGNGHKITGFSETTAANGGLFRTLGSNAKVTDLTIENPNITSTQDQMSSGALAGCTKGKVTIKNVHISGGSVTGKFATGGIIGQATQATVSAEFLDCSNTATITSDGQHAGGILGRSYNVPIDFSGCVNGVEGDSTKGMVSAPNGCAGGIAGRLGNTDVDPTYTGKNCKNYANITGMLDSGGIVGIVNSDSWNHDFSGSFNAGNIKVTSVYGAAGIIGASNGGGNLQSCVNTGSVTSGSFAGGILGWNEDDPIDFSISTNKGTITAVSNGGGIAGFLGKLSSGTYTGHACVNEGKVTVEGASGIAGGIVGRISNTSNYADFARCINRGDVRSHGDKHNMAGGILGCIHDGNVNVSYSENYAQISGNSYHLFQIIGFHYSGTAFDDTGIVCEGSVVKDVSEGKSLKDLSNDELMALLDDYKRMIEYQEVRENTSEYLALQEQIAAAEKLVKARNHQKVPKDPVLEAISARLGEGWKILMSDDIKVTCFDGKDINGKFTIGFSAKGLDRYKYCKAIVYHVLDDGTVEELIPTWNEENHCFTVVVDNFSQFVLAVDTANVDTGMTANDSNLPLIVSLLVLVAAGLVLVLIRRRMDGTEA